MLRLTTGPLSLQVILLFSDNNQFKIQYLTVLMTFLHKTTPSKWKQGTLLVILHDGLYIFRYTFSIFQYTFIECEEAQRHTCTQFMLEIPPEDLDYIPVSALKFFLQVKYE